MRLLRRLARLAAITTLLGGTAALAAATSPAASAARAAAPDGWVRIAHLSSQAPAMDMYLYPFGKHTVLFIVAVIPPLVSERVTDQSLMVTLAVRSAVLVVLAFPVWLLRRRIPGLRPGLVRLSGLRSQASPSPSQPGDRG